MAAVDMLSQILPMIEEQLQKVSRVPFQLEGTAEAREQLLTALQEKYAVTSNDHVTFEIMHKDVYARCKKRDEVFDRLFANPSNEPVNFDTILNEIVESTPIAPGH